MSFGSTAGKPQAPSPRPTFLAKNAPSWAQSVGLDVRCEDLPDESGASGPTPPAAMLDDLAEGKYEGDNADLRRAMAVNAED